MPRADGPFKVLEKINDNAYDEDMTTLDMTKNIAYMHICQVILVQTIQ